MGRRRKSETAKKKKKVNVSLLQRLNAGRVTQPYRILQDLIEKHHRHLIDAKIAIAWNVGGSREDADGRVVLGKVKKGSDLDRELAPYDFVIVLNHDVWNAASFSEHQMNALLDDMLCRCAVSKDKNGEPRIDEKNRVCFRTRKPDLVGFREVVSRWGLWTRDLEEFAKAAEEAKARPLLNQPPEASPKKPRKSNGKAAEASSRTDPAGIRVHDPDAAKAAQVRERAEILNDGTTDCLAAKKFDTAHDMGEQSFKDGVRLEDCPMEPGAEQDDWIRGWLGAEALERYEQPETVAS
jgi:hypothetical protein